MKGKLHDRYSGIRTKRGSILYRSNSRILNGEKSSNKSADNSETNSTSTDSGRGTFGSPEYLEKNRKKIADDSIALRAKRTNAIEQFRDELQLDPSVPHYRVLEVAFSDYVRMKEKLPEGDKLTKGQLNEFLDQSGKQLHCQKMEQPSTVTNEQN